MNNPVDWNPTFTKIQPPTATHLRIRSVHDAHKLFHAVYLEKLPMVVRRLDAEERKLIKSGDVHVWEERGPSTEGLGLGIERWTDGKLWGPSRVRDNFLFYHEKEREPADFHGGSKWAKMLSGGVVVFRRRSRGEGSSTAYTGALPTSLDANGNPMGMEMGVLHPNDQTPSTSGDPSSGQEFNVCTKDRLVKQTYSVLVKLPKQRGGVEVRKWHMTAYFAPNPSDPRPLLTIEEITLFSDLEVPNGMYQPARVGRGMGRHRSTTGLDPTGTGSSRGVHIPTDGEESHAPGDRDEWMDSRARPNVNHHPGKPADIEDNKNIVAHMPVASSSKPDHIEGPPSLAPASMPVVPSHPPSLGAAIRTAASPGTQSIYRTSPPPPSPSMCSVRSISAASETSSGRRCFASSRPSAHRYSPYVLPSTFNSGPPSPTMTSPRTSFEKWGSTQSSFLSTCGKVQLPPLSYAVDRCPPRHRNEAMHSYPYSIPSSSRSRSSSISEGASSITQSLQTPQTRSPPHRVLIDGSSVSPPGMVPLPSLRTSTLPQGGYPSTKSETMHSSTLPQAKSHDLVPLSFLKTIRAAKESQYSNHVSYAPASVSTRRPVDEEILKGLGI